MLQFSNISRDYTADIKNENKIDFVIAAVLSPL